MLIILISSIGWSTEYFVDKGGSGDFTAIQAALNSVSAGDIITVKNGVYNENLSVPRSGTSGNPIILRAENPLQVTVKKTSSGNTLRLQVSYIQIEGLIFDGNWYTGNVLYIDDNADYTIVKNCIIRNSAGSNLILIDNANNCQILNCEIYNGLRGTFATQADCHGICVTDHVYNLLIKGCNIHHVSGDCFQADPSRLDWGGDIYIEDSQLWTGALPSGTYPSGWSAGHRPGENGIDTKVDGSNSRAILYVRDCDFYGWRNTNIPTPSALNLKEKVRVFVERCRVYDSYIGFRLRGPGSNGGAEPKIHNCFIYDNTYGIRFEDEIENVELCNNTFDNNTAELYDGGGGGPNGYHEASYRSFNNVFVGALPAFGADHSSNKAVSVSNASTYFMNRSGGDYHLTQNAVTLIDAGIEINGSKVGYPFNDDFDGDIRPIGNAWDVGADEAVSGDPNNPPVANNDTASVNEDSSATVDVLANDTDLDSDQLSVISNQTPAHGSAVINGDNTITYTPYPDFNGSDSFTYTISDGNGGTDTATVNITVNPVNDGPVAVADANPLSGDAPLTVTFDGTGSSDIDGSIVSYAWDYDDGGAAGSGAGSSYTYNQAGVYTVVLTVTDNQGATAAGTIQITVSDPGDTEPPTIPQNLAAIPISSAEIDLIWDASTDNVGVAGYRIFRNGVEIATTANINYSDTGLTPATLYTYEVTAYDASGNESVKSNSDSATTLASNNDKDGDGMDDNWEDDNGLDPDDPNDGDFDNDKDGLTNKEEFQHDTDPFDPDTDGDLFGDGYEVDNNTDPLDPDDNPTKKKSISDSTPGCHYNANSDPISAIILIIISLIFIVGVSVRREAL
jgi:chitodextrinase